MAKKSKKAAETKKLQQKMLKSAERRCLLLGTDDLKIVLLDATMRISRAARIGEYDDAELYANIVMIVLKELRRRE